MISFRGLRVSKHNCERCKVIVSTDYEPLRVGTWQSGLSRNEVFKRFPDKRSWWIDSSGEVFDAENDHYQFIKDHPELFDDEIILTYHAIKRFWVRVSEWGPSFTIQSRNINQAQLDAAQTLYMREGKGKKVEFFQEGVIQTSFDKEEFLALQNVHQLKRMRSRVGSSLILLSSDYKNLRVAGSLSEGMKIKHPDKRSWWVSPQGDVFDAGYYHDKFIEENPEIFPGITNSKTALSQSWARIGSWGGLFIIDARNLNQAQLDAAQGIYRREGQNTKIGFISTRGVDPTSWDGDEFLSLSNVNQFKRPRPRLSSSSSDAVKKDYPEKRSWWVDPQGKIFDSGHDHNKFLAERPKTFGKWADINKALTMNWIRVAFWGGEYVVHCHVITKAQVAACQEIYKSLGGEHKIYIATLNKYGYISPHDFIWADSPSDLIRNLFKDPTGIRASVTASASDRAWLISPQGKAYLCGFDHNTCSSNKELTKIAKEINPTLDEGYVVDVLLEAGWARCGYFDEGAIRGNRGIPAVAFLDSWKSITVSVFSKFKELVSSWNLSDNTKVVVGKDTFFWKDFKFFDSMTDAKKFLRYGREGSSRRRANGSDRAWMLSPSGELVACGWDHDFYVKEHEEGFGIQHGDPNPVETLIDRGWTKVGILGRILYFVCKRITQKTLDELHSFVLKDSYIQDIQVIDYSLAGGEALELPRDEFLQMNKPSALRWMFNIRGSRRSSRTGFEERAWLISPANEVISCGWNHNNFIRNNLERFGVSTDADPNSVEFKDPSMWLVENGWTKVGKHNTIIYFECITLPQKLLNTLQDFVKRDPDIEYIQAVIYLKSAGTPIMPELKRDEFIWLDKPADLIKRSHVRASKQAASSSRAWFVSPDREVIECGQDHTNFVKNNQDLFRSKGAGGKEPEQLVKEGWGRIGLLGPLLYMNCERLNNFFFKTLQELTERFQQVGRVLIENKVIDRNEFLFMDGPGDVRRVLVNTSRQRFASQYGGRAWLISPEGEPYNCSEDHLNCAYEGPLDQLWSEEGFEEGDSAEKGTIIGKWLDRNGWAKVGYFNNIRLVYLFARKLDNRMFKAFKEILSGWDLDDRAQIEVSDPSRSVFWWEDFRWFDSVLDMKKFARGVASRRRSASKYEGRAWLVSPQGQIVDCGDDHEEFVLNNQDFFKELGYNITSAYPLVDDGWARVGILETYLYVECNTLTTKCFDILQDITLRKEFLTKVEVTIRNRWSKFSRKEFLELESPLEIRRNVYATRRKTSSLPKSRNFLMGVDLESMPWPLRKAFDLLNLSEKKDKLSANQVASVFQANDKLLQDHVGRTATELIQELNFMFQYGIAHKQIA